MAWLAIAWRWILGSRTAQIAIVVGMVLMLGRCGWSHYQGVKADLAIAEARLTICKQASQSQIDTIKTLEAAQADNSERYKAQLDRSAEAAGRVSELEQELQEATDAAISEAVEAASADDCAGAALPDALRLRLRP